MVQNELVGRTKPSRSEHVEGKGVKKKKEGKDCFTELTCILDIARSINWKESRTVWVWGRWDHPYQGNLESLNLALNHAQSS